MSKELIQKKDTKKKAQKTKAEKKAAKREKKMGKSGSGDLNQKFN